MRALMNLVEKQITESWDMGGAWITDDGDVELCDHHAGHHHVDIALEYYGDGIDPGGPDGQFDEHDGDAAMHTAYGDGWIHVTTFGERSIVIDWRGHTTPQARAALLDYLRGLPPFETYGVKAGDAEYQEFPDANQAMGYLRRLP